jgi:hypothetical protein
MDWVDGYHFYEPFEDLRDDATAAQGLAAELSQELADGHPLMTLPWTVVARALPQDEVLVRTPDGAALVHMTWARHPEQPPYPSTLFLATVEDFEREIEFRY